MRRQIPVVWSIWIGGSDDGSRSELANGDMIGMPIRAIWPKSDHHIGLHSAQVFHDLCHGFCRRGLIQVAIQVIQKLNPANTKHSGCCQQLRLAYLAQCLQAWIVALVAEPTAFAPRCGDKVRLDPFGGVLRKYAAVAERLIIWVSQDTHQFQFVGHTLSLAAALLCKI